VIALLQAGKLAVADLITHRLPLADAARGFRLVAEGKKSLKVIVKPHES
jgi:L-iditol 2-dehydrogenase